MTKIAAVLVVAMTSISLWGQTGSGARCLQRPEFAPTLVSNLERKVTFHCAQASAMELIRAIGYQTRVPIGIVLGRDLDALSRTRRVYDSDGVDVVSALRRAVEGSGYQIREVGSVLVLIAGDETPRQRDLLSHRYSNFKSNAAETMVSLGMDLTMWMRAFVDPKLGFAMDLLSSTNDERFTLHWPGVASTEEIANRIASQGSRGLWILSVTPSALSQGSTDEIVMEPYQHYSNRPIDIR